MIAEQLDHATMEQKRTLSIIIVNWNGKDVLPACLRSVAENPPGVDYRVIVVDNASTDESRQWLASGEAAKLFPEGCFEVILNDENVGFGRANNQAMRAFPSDFFFLLNPDCTIEKKAIDC
ncbi:MAG: glycosyltransferase, partial [Acidobacteria bacterium]